MGELGLQIEHAHLVNRLERSANHPTGGSAELIEFTLKPLRHGRGVPRAAYLIPHRRVHFLGELHDVAVAGGTAFSNVIIIALAVGEGESQNNEETNSAHSSNTAHA